MIRVGLADDQQIVRAGFAMVLDSQDDVQVVWEAADGAAAVACCAADPVDVVFMDIQMPRLNGIEATARLAVDQPQVRVVMLTTFDEDDYVMGAIAAGASGFLLKDCDPEELLRAARVVGEQEAVISPKATARLIRRMRQTQQRQETQQTHSAQDATPGAVPGPALPAPDLVEPLTPREEEILQLVARGFSNAEIAAQLVLSLPTVKTHVGHILAKTGSRDRVHAVLFAFRHGLVAPGDLLG